MGKRKLNVEEQIEALSQSIQDSVKRWKEIKKKGTTDPFYPDGTNLNLVRNHIIYDKGRLKELCVSRKDCPKEARLTIPKRVSDKYIVPGSKCGPAKERAKKARKR